MDLHVGLASEIDWVRAVGSELIARNRIMPPLWGDLPLQGEVPSVAEFVRASSSRSFDVEPEMVVLARKRSRGARPLSRDPEGDSRPSKRRGRHGRFRRARTSPWAAAAVASGREVEARVTVAPRRGEGMTRVAMPRSTDRRAGWRDVRRRNRRQVGRGGLLGRPMDEMTMGVQRVGR